MLAMFLTKYFTPFFSFLLDVLSMFAGVIISRYYQGESIFPISKTISVSFGSTILYFLIKFINRLNIEPYGDILICASVGLVAETIFAIIFANKVKIIKTLFEMSVRQRINMKEFMDNIYDEDENEKKKDDNDNKDKDNNNDFLSKL